MIDVTNTTKHSINTANLQMIADEISKRDIELILCDDKYIHSLNIDFRGKDSATDVLSFPLDGDRDSEPLGSIVISVDKVAAKAKELNHTQENELTLLFMHGLLHLMGFDHETDDGEMRAEEKRLIRKFKLPESLIIRTEIC